MSATALAVGLCSAAHAATGPAYVVKDLTTGTEPGASSDPGPFFDLGQTTLFPARDDAHGLELWRTDGTTAGTALVKDLVEGPADGVAAIGHVVADGVLYFGAARGGLWRSDGTAAGTFAVADVTPWSVIADGNRLYAIAAVDHDGFSLVRIDLPSGATTRLGDFRGGEIDPSLTIVAGRLFFAAVAGREGLWTSDGTPEGTRQVRAVTLANREGGNDQTELIAVGGQLFFTARDEAGWELWRSDGTEAGTERVRDINPGGNGIHFNDYLEAAQPFFTALGDVLVFMADDGISGLEPWRSDGTEAGTVRIADVWPGPLGVDGTDGDDDESDVAQRIVRTVPFHDRLFFTARSGDGPVELWVTEGTAATTSRVAPIDSSIGYLGDAVADSRLIYISGYSGLWVSDGTAVGSASIATIDQVAYLTTARGGVVFSGRDPVAGFEPWVSDGTAARTHRLADIARGIPGLDPRQLTDLAGTLLFTADDGEHGRELWRSDGTAVGTRMVADIAAGAAGSYPVELVTSGTALFFSADDGRGRTLWRSDGTAAGTVRVGGPAKPTGLATDGGGGVYFFAAEPRPASFWRSDGTVAGAQLLRAGEADAVEYGPLPPVLLGDIAVFVPTSPSGHSLWRTDGTALGTAPLAEFPHVPDAALVTHLTRVGDIALFFVIQPDGGAALWRTDGTAAGTTEVATVGRPAFDTVVTDDGRMLFNESTVGGYRLWQSDGTPGGTFGVSTARHLSATRIAAVGARVFAITFDAQQTVFGELGCVDLLETVDAFSTLGSLTGLGDRLLLAEVLPSGAQRLWTSDGTRAGTTALQELPAPDGSGPLLVSAFVRSGGRAFFAARQGDAGRELWALPLSAVPPVAPAPCEPPPTPTPVPDRATPGPFECPFGTHCTVLEIEPTEGRAGERVTFSVVLHARDLPIAGVQNDITLPDGMVLLADDSGRPACTVEPSIEKEATAFAFQPPGCTPGADCPALRALVLSYTGTEPIYDGAVLYRCELLLSHDLEPGDYSLVLSNLAAADPDGLAVELDGIDGVVTVEDRSGAHPVAEANGGADGCQTATPHGRTSPAAWALLGVLAVGLARRRTTRPRRPRLGTARAPAGVRHCPPGRRRA